MRPDPLFPRPRAAMTSRWSSRRLEVPTRTDGSTSCAEPRDRVAVSRCSLSEKPVKCPTQRSSIRSHPAAAWPRACGDAPGCRGSTRRTWCRTGRPPRPGHLRAGPVERHRHLGADARLPLSAHIGHLALYVSRSGADMAVLARACPTSEAEPRQPVFPKAETPIHNIAKVGVKGSNTIVRSKSSWKL